MSAPMYAPTGMVQNPELASIRSLLNVSKIIALVFWILGIVWILAEIAAIAFAATYGFGAYAAWNIVYPVLFTILNLLTWLQMPNIENHVAAGQFNSAKEKTLLWGILELIGGLVVGILLLIAWSKFDAMMRWQPSLAAPGTAMGWTQPQPQAAPYAAPAYSPAPVAPAPAPQAAPAAAPVTAAPPQAAAPPTAPCPRCGGTATWIAQYNRWYCYTCQQYL